MNKETNQETKETMDYVKELSFVRVAGSAEERKAAELIMGEIDKTAKETGREDIRGEYMTFRIPDAKVVKCSVRVAGRELPCVPYLRSGNIDRECGLVYLEETSLYPRRLREHFTRNGVIPVKRGMSEDMKKELDKYFHREEENA